MNSLTGDIRRVGDGDLNLLLSERRGRGLFLDKRDKDLLPKDVYIKGEWEKFVNSPRVAIVGVRDSDREDLLEKTRAVSCYLSTEGFNIVSGYARGVDRHAHLAALEAGGLTTMVLPFGMKYLFSKDQEIQWDPLFEPPVPATWESQALWISPFAWQQVPNRRTPLRRNKWTCHLSKAIIVMASHIGGGTFYTAKLALRMSKPLWVWDTDIQGNQELIRRYNATPFKDPQTIDLSEIMSKP
ncbi:MAG: DNA-processing protein DprA [Cytophagales bacterium]|nr:DNA-processing protein DprA [Cytophagales bacterium]